MFQTEFADLNEIFYAMYHVPGTLTKSFMRKLMTRFQVKRKNIWPKWNKTKLVQQFYYRTQYKRSPIHWFSTFRTKPADGRTLSSWVRFMHFVRKAHDLISSLGMCISFQQSMLKYFEFQFICTYSFTKNTGTSMFLSLVTWINYISISEDTYTRPRVLCLVTTTTIKYTLWYGHPAVIRNYQVNKRDRQSQL